MTAPKQKDADAEPDARPAAAAARTLDADDGEPGLSVDEYLERRRDLEARLLALEVRWRSQARFPRWVYHASLAPRIVASRAERQALGPGWHVTPV